MAPGVVQGIELAAELAPLAMGLVKALIELGHSPEEAAAIVRRDIASLRSKYEAQKKEDRDALDRKHGRDADAEFEEP